MKERNTFYVETERLSPEPGRWREYESSSISADDPNTVVVEAAVMPFGERDRVSLYTEPLQEKDLRTAISENNKNIAKYGVSIDNIKKRLRLYVDFGIIKEVLDIRKGVLKISDLQVDSEEMTPEKITDEIFTEAIHQFQAKILMYNTEKKKENWDGIVGPITLSSLGFIFHKEKKFKKTDANGIIKGKFKSIDSDIIDYIKKIKIKYLENINGENWYNYIINPSVFGRPGKKDLGFHVVMILDLRKAEKTLMDKYFGADLNRKYINYIEKHNEVVNKVISRRKSLQIYQSLQKKPLRSVIQSALRPSSAAYSHAGYVPRLLGEVLNINEAHGDIRKVSENTPKSFHLSGLAIDIKYGDNPWVRGSTGMDILNEAASETVKETLKEKKTLKTAQEYFGYLAENYSTAEIFDILKKINDDCIKHFKNEKGEINWGGSTRLKGKEKGFLNLRKELVVTLRDRVGFAWGAIDFGIGDQGNGDMMHFDMRTSPIGRAYFKAIGTSSTYLAKVHPSLKQIDLGQFVEPKGPVVLGQQQDSLYQKLIVSPPPKPSSSNPLWITGLRDKIKAGLSNGSREFEQLNVLENTFADWLIFVSTKLTKYPGVATLPLHLIGLYESGVKSPNKLSDHLFLKLLPDMQGKKTLNAEQKLIWKAIYSYLALPYLIFRGRAVVTLNNNLMLPDKIGKPLLLTKNKYGVVLFPENGLGFARYTQNPYDIYTHPQTKKTGKWGDNWVHPQTGADFYNAIQEFRETPDGQNVIIHYGDISAINPSINLGHGTHFTGKSIDLRYIGIGGKEERGVTAYQIADIQKMNKFLEIAESYNFTKIFTYGNRFQHKGNKNHHDHNDHFHIGQ